MVEHCVRNAGVGGSNPLASTRHDVSWADHRPAVRPKEMNMCRNIRVLANFEPPATSEEIRSAALQYVRKIAGASKPSEANREVFERAVEEVAATSVRLLDELVTKSPPRNREVEADRARARAEKRYAR